MIYLKLFLSFLQIGLFSFGGGYSVLPLIQQQVVINNHWLNMEDFTNIITISQMTPGPIAINASTLAGIKIAGIPGALIAVSGCVLPTTLIAIIIGHYYYKYRNTTLIKGIFKYLPPAVVALIASAGTYILVIEILGNLSYINWIAIINFSICLIILRKLKPNPIYIILISGAAGVLFYYKF